MDDRLLDAAPARCIQISKLTYLSFGLKCDMEQIRAMPQRRYGRLGGVAQGALPRPFKRFSAGARGAMKRNVYAEWMDRFEGIVGSEVLMR